MYVILFKCVEESFKEKLYKILFPECFPKEKSRFVFIPNARFTANASFFSCKVRYETKRA